VVFVSPPLLPVLQKSGANVKHTVLLCRKADKPDGDYKCIEELWGEPIEPKPIPETDTAYLCYSSGTTGKAKGVETSHHNITSQIQALNTVYEPLGKTDVVLGILPFSHIYGECGAASLTAGLSVVLHQPLTRGVPVVILPRFEESSVLDAVEKHKITWGLIVPPILIALIHSKNIGDRLRSVRGFMSGAAPLGPELTAAFEKKFPWIKVTQG
jgi:acyl-CoA synthetase (AMP-forming)/AMP-acid ligase II